MTEIAFEPWKKVTVRDVIKYENPADLYRDFVSMFSGHGGYLCWANDVIFCYQAPPYFNSDILAQKFVDGEVIFINVMYAPKKNYESRVKAPNGPEISVVDASKDTLLGQIAQYFKTTMSKT